MKNEEFTIYIVPDYIIGKPKYNFSNCIQYLIFRLKHNGFILKYYYPNAIQISWKTNNFNSILKKTTPKLYIENNTKIKDKKPDNIIINFNKNKMVKKDKIKENKFKENKFKAINNFIPRTNIFNNY